MDGSLARDLKTHKVVTVDLITELSRLERALPKEKTRIRVGWKPGLNQSKFLFL